MTNEGLVCVGAEEVEMHAHVYIYDPVVIYSVSWTFCVTGYVSEFVFVSVYNMSQINCTYGLQIVEDKKFVITI